MNLGAHYSPKSVLDILLLVISPNADQLSKFTHHDTQQYT